ncbi:cytochrome P450, partial [Tanacetum coccineum]
MVKECFGTNDKFFASRPDIAVSRYMVYDHASFGLAQYGPLWREIRKLVTSELFTSQRLEKFKNVCNTELKDSIKELSIMSTKNKEGISVVEMNKWFENMTFKINIRMLVGNRSFSKAGSSDGNNKNLQLEEAIKKGLYLTGVFVLSDVIPYLEWMDIGGHLKAMKQLAQDLDSVISKWLDEHVEKRKEYNGDKEADLMDVMLSTLSNDAEMFGHGRETIIKATALEGEKRVEESDIKNLTYLQAIVKETLRMYPPGSLGAPREAIEDCDIGGYHVSKGTRLIVNIWKLHHDARRRMCPATTFALRVVHLTLARLLQGFDLSTPMGKPVDMTEGFGLSLPKMVKECYTTNAKNFATRLNMSVSRYMTYDHAGIGLAPYGLYWQQTWKLEQESHGDKEADFMEVMLSTLSSKVAEWIYSRNHHQGKQL